MSFPRPCDGCGHIVDLTFIATGTAGRGREIPTHTGEWLCDTCGPRRFPAYPWDDTTHDTP